MRKILLTYSSFVIACFVVIMAFITATTYLQLAVAILLYPVLVYFAFKIFPRKVMITPLKNPIITPIQSFMGSEQKVEEDKRENLGVSDIDKRLFLKIIGGTGISLFLFSIFNKRAKNLFFKNLPASGNSGRVVLEDTSGNKINPAQSGPTDGYTISEVEDNMIAFYGFTNKEGAWFIMKQDTDVGSFRYSKGNLNFSENWANREKLKYDYFSSVF